MLLLLRGSDLLLCGSDKPGAEIFNQDLGPLPQPAPWIVLAPNMRAEENASVYAGAVYRAVFNLQPLRALCQRKYACFHRYFLGFTLFLLFSLDFPGNSAR
jgi:hypothetical protein